jgi:hypothetical protein
MKTLYVGLLMAALAAAMFAQGQKTVYVDKMEGLEPFVEKALVDAELPFQFVEETKRPEMKADLKRNHSAYAEILYRHKMGRSETHTLELLDVESGKVIVSHTFELKGDDTSRQKAAAAFAAKVRGAMANKR